VLGVLLVSTTQVQRRASRPVFGQIRKASSSTINPMDECAIVTANRPAIGSHDANISCRNTDDAKLAAIAFDTYYALFRNLGLQR